MPDQNFLPFRQIHLDFHTSEHIAGIGAAFDPDEFADTLVKAHVNSITCFARCHHGWIYYDSKVNPERIHPHLSRDLLREQIEACHKRGIRVPIYTTIQWDYVTANEHPEWVVIQPDGRLEGTPPLEAGFYQRLAVNSPYMDFLKAHVQEILETMPVDGFFFDIMVPTDDLSRWTRAEMEAQGLDIADEGARRRYGLEVIRRFKREMTAFVRQFNRECSIFYNRGHIGPEHRPVVDAYTHWELESLPSGHWGYLHFPMAVRYARNLGLDYMGHTGKFHTAWGDFHSFKNQAALEYECFRMLAHGAKCMIGDQLDPSGKIDPYVYQLVGAVYEQVEQKEPWCDEVEAVVDIGVLTPEESAGMFAFQGTMPPALKGITRMLEEGAHQFDILDSHSDLSRYKVVILPDTIAVSAVLAARLENYLAAGGALIATFESGLNDEDFAARVLGVQMTGEGPRDLQGQLVRGRHFPKADYVEYLLPEGDIGRDLPPTEHAMYIRGTEIAALPDSQVLANIVRSHFDRTYQHFCSHRQTPSSGQISHPGIVQHGRAIYFSNPIFTQYQQNAPRWCKTLFLNALSLLLPQPLIRHDGPSTLCVTLNAQAQQQRWVVHLLHYIPERRGEEFDIIEDVIPLYNVKCSVRVEEAVRSVELVPAGGEIEYQTAGQRIEFTVPEVRGHQMIVISFA